MTALLILFLADPLFELLKFILNYNQLPLFSCGRQITLITTCLSYVVFFCLQNQFFFFHDVSLLALHSVCFFVFFHWLITLLREHNISFSLFSLGGNFHPPWPSSSLCTPFVFLLDSKASFYEIIQKVKFNKLSISLENCTYALVKCACTLSVTNINSVLKLDGN